MQDWPELADGVLAACMDAFAVPVVHLPYAGGGPYARRGSYAAPAQAVDLKTEIPVSSSAPSLGIQLSAWTVAPDQDDVIRFEAAVAVRLGFGNANIDFLVEDVQPDGQGGAKLILKRKPPGA